MSDSIQYQIERIKQQLRELERKVDRIAKEEPHESTRVTVHHLYAEKLQLDQLTYQLETLDVKELSGTLNLGNNFHITRPDKKTKATHDADRQTRSSAHEADDRANVDHPHSDNKEAPEEKRQTFKEYERPFASKEGATALKVEQGETNRYETAGSQAKRSDEGHMNDRLNKSNRINRQRSPASRSKRKLRVQPSSGGISVTFHKEE